MKFNWGTGLVIGMLAFISFIMYFVVTMMSSSEYDHDLVVEDYYNAELHYQQDIDAETNALSLDENLSLKNENGKLILVFPENLDIDKMNGAIYLYRPSNKKLDFQIPLSEVTTNQFFIPSDKLVEGRWNLMVRWKMDEKDFLFRKNLVY